MDLKISAKDIIIADRLTKVLTYLSRYESLSLSSQRSVAVITCASHAQGPRFDPGR